MGKPLSDETTAAYYFANEGRRLKVSEAADRQAVNITLFSEGGESKTVSLNREQWRALCNLRDRVRVL